MAAKRSTSRIFRGSRVEDEVALCASVAPAGVSSASSSSDAGELALGSSTSGYNTLGSPAPVLQSPRQVRRKSRRDHEQIPDEDELVDYAAQHTPAGAVNTVNTGATTAAAAAAGGHADNEPLREVYFNYAPGNAVFDKCSNVVVTSKYSLVTFLPKFVKESFSKVANFFFLMVCVLQSIPSISNTYGYPTNAPVLFFVISIDAVFAVMEDLRRHKSDNEANSATCHVIQDGHVVDRKWADIKVGDFLQIRNREVIPADVLVLAVSEPVGSRPAASATSRPRVWTERRTSSCARPWPPP